MIAAKAWLSEFRFAGGAALDKHNGETTEGNKEKLVLGILSFEAAATMSKLLAIYHTLSEERVLELRRDTMRSQGVAYLVSTDQSFLLRLACAEIIDDLDRAAAVVSRLGSRCRDSFINPFHRVYAELKSGSVQLDRLVLASTKKGLEKKVKKMEKLVSSTSKLNEEMESLAELEAAERKMTGGQWNRLSGPIPSQAKNIVTVPDDMLAEIKIKRQKVKKLKEESLWTQSFDDVVTIMGRAICTVFARICLVFAAVPGIPPVIENKENSRTSFVKSRINQRFPFKFSSGPMEREQTSLARSEIPLRSSSPIIGQTARDNQQTPSWAKMKEGAGHTVGAFGLSLRYAEVITLTERVLELRSAVEEDCYDAKECSREEAATREELYKMLPAGLRAAVKGKLKETWRDAGQLDGDLAKGWKEAVGRIMAWLAPVAHDTLRWQSERSMDRRQRFDMRPRAFVMQTLQFADREKTEAAVVEVLAGLSCVCWYDERRGNSLREFV